MAINNINYGNLFSGVNNINNINQINSLYNSIYGGNNVIGTNNYSNYGRNTANHLVQSAQNFVTNAKTYSKNLKETLQNLMGRGKEQSVFAKTTAVSSDTDKMTVQSVGNKAAINTTVKIEQLAKGQENTGASMDAGGMNFQQNNYYQFEIDVSGKKTQISFTTKSGDNNRAVQQRMADAINAKNLGVQAKVTYDATSRTSRLELSSAQTGAAENGSNYFSIRDMQGDAVSRTGVGSVTQTAQDAVYRVNDGAAKTSKSNTVDLGNGLTVQFLKASDETLKIEAGSDLTAQQNKVRDMVNQYNGLLEAAQDNNKDRRTASLAQQLSLTAKTYTTSLSRIGINVGQDGFISIDADKMKKAAESGELEKYFDNDSKGTNYGFSSRVSRIAQNVERNPISYVGRDSMADLRNSSYVDDTGNYWANMNMNTRFSQWMNVGMLFNSYF